MCHCCAGGRWRCLAHLVHHTRLCLSLLDTLDMIGRTAELARAFGIDFFSVLSRGSQYRVESLMVRLAHSQNYLAISPSRDQVGCLAVWLYGMKESVLLAQISSSFACGSDSMSFGYERVSGCSMRYTNGRFSLEGLMGYVKPGMSCIQQTEDWGVLCSYMLHHPTH